MELSIGTNFDDELIRQLKTLSVKEKPDYVLYGKLPQDVFGGGRPSFALPQIDEKRLLQHIRLAHGNGMEFNYLLNTVCMDNLELTKDVNGEVVRFLEKLTEWEVDWVTVSMPYLIDLVKKRMPHVKVAVSLFADINSIQKAKHYESLGVDEITLPESFNRNFGFLRQVKKSIATKVRLIATNDCMFSCPYQNIHPVYQSHASQENHISQGFPFDYCLLKCTYEKLKDPSQYIKACWIRPEDLGVYEAFDYHSFKLTERMKKTENILKMAKAYSDRRWDGNLAEILNVKLSQEDFVMPDFSYTDKPEFADAEKFSRTFPLLFTNRVWIDNRKLDGFLDHFQKKGTDCQQSDCEECGYCGRIAKETVRVLEDAGQQAEFSRQYEELFEQLCDGSFFVQDPEEERDVWTAESEALFEKMILLKPDFIQSFARQAMKGEAERLASQKGRGCVDVDVLIEANVNTTPKEMHLVMLNGIKRELGLDVSRFLEGGGCDET